MRVVVAVGLLVMAFSGCIMEEWSPGSVPTSNAGLETLAWTALAERQGSDQGYSLRAVHAIEALALEERGVERTSAPIGSLLRSNDPERLDGLAHVWMFLFRGDDGSTVHVRIADGRVVGHGSITGVGSFHPYFESLDSGTRLIVPEMDSVEAAGLARATGMFDDVVDDPGWDLRMTLQHWKGAEAPIWVIDAVARDSEERIAVGFDTQTKEPRTVAVRPLRFDSSLTTGLAVPLASGETTFEVPDQGYHRLQVVSGDAFLTSTEVIDPSGNIHDRMRSKNPLPGTWTVRATSLLPGETIEVTACLDHWPPFRSGKLPGPCDR